MHNVNYELKQSFTSLFLLFTLFFSAQLIAATQQQKLVASDGAMDDYFGGSVSISGDYAVVGARQVEINGDRYGAAYAFKYDGTSWVETQKLLSSIPYISENYGTSVSISGDTIAVGSTNAFVNNLANAGVVYIYKRDSNGVWNESDRLFASDHDRYDNFGTSVSLENNQLIIGAPNNDDSFNASGSAYIFDYDGVNWNETDKLTASNPASSDRFGFKVDINGNRAIVSTPNSDEVTVGDSVGSVYVFEKGITDWTETEILRAPDMDEGDNFGIDISLSGDRVLVGAYRNDDTALNSGSAYIFEYNPLNTTWDSGLKINANDPAANDSYGGAVKIDGDKMLIGAVGNDDGNDLNSGSVYSYYFNGNTWEFIELILHTDSPTRFTDAFGEAIDIDNGQAIIGSYLDDGSEGQTFNSGAAYILDVDNQPIAVLDTKTVNEDDLNTNIDVLFNDTDTDGGTKIITGLTQPVNGSATLNNTNTLVVYTPNLNYCNDGTTTDDFTYTVNGGSTTTVEITVTCIDDLPIAVDNDIEIIEDSDAVTIQVLNNDTDIDGGPLFVESFTQPNNGLVMAFGSDLRYTPNINYCSAPADNFIATRNGGLNTSDNFTYTLNGGSTAIVSVFVNCVDDFPIAVLDAVSVNEDQDYSQLDILDNDTDVDDGPMTIIEFTQPSNGTVINHISNITYKPDSNYCNDGNTTDDFTYTLNGGNTTTVNMTVICIDDAPVAVADSPILDEDDISVNLLILNNDTDIDNGPMLITIMTQPNNGILINNNDHVIYTPNENYCNDGNTTDDFNYSLNGGSSATVSITVSCIDDLPVAIDDAVIMIEDDNPTVIDVLFNDTDVDEGTMKIGSVTQPDHGTVSFTENNVTYTADADYCNFNLSPDTFTYTLTDGSNALVSVVVNCVNDAPRFLIDGDLNFNSSGSQQVSIANFADDFVYGPSDESTQNIIGFNVSINSDGSNIINTINIDNSGTLNIDFSLNTGVAIISVVMQDNGGNNNGGVDTSHPVEFNVTFSDVLFAGGFEELELFSIVDYLNKLSIDLNLFENPFYDYESDSIFYKGFILELNSEDSTENIKLNIMYWINEVDYNLNKF